MKAKAILICSISAALLSAAQALTIDTVSVGDPGNPHDPLTGNLYGGVSYTYNIGKYEVTLNQYTEFLNAVAATDTYGLYNAGMGTDLNIKGITRTGSPGSYAYSVFGDGQRPVTYVSWFDAARFSNWLHNGQPTGLQVAGTTEQGAYALNGAVSGVGFSRGVGAQYWIPSENEWYKAAYYQPLAAGGDADGYWEYPMGSNAIPNSRNGSVSDANSANFYRNDSIANGFNDGYAVSGSPSYSSSQQYLTPVGAYTLADSYYGTFDQGGNVWEWSDAVNFASRVLKGGAWDGNQNGLRASWRFLWDNPTNEYDSIGFRVATVPEPSTTVLMCSAGLLASARRRRQRSL